MSSIISMVFCLLLSFVFVAFAIMWVSARFKKKQQYKQSCSVKVTASVVDVSSYRTMNEKGKYENVYTIYYEYTYMGQTYRRAFDSSISKELGTQRDFYINPNNPNEIYDNNNGLSFLIYAVVLGVIFFIVLAMVLVRR